MTTAERGLCTQEWGPWPRGRGFRSARCAPLSLRLSLASACSSIWLLLRNPTFILLCLAGATEATLIAGMSTFGPKFLEAQFSLSASEAATLFGEKTLWMGRGGSSDLSFVLR